MAAFAEGVDTIAVDGGSRAGAAFVIDGIEGAGVGMLPKLASGLGVERVNGVGFVAVAERGPFATETEEKPMPTEAFQS
jgi:hypothetical protein